MNLKSTLVRFKLIDINENNADYDKPKITPITTLEKPLPILLKLVIAYLILLIDLTLI